ncbi:MAG TPA: magnesium transporter [Candidatus Omnitrophota bacterium]|nr:magnesium transporter [Candidatus Omnitrophota bacterium]HPS19369.1 magnesium transporter [Candidatus Omnitrophota bacterium]
MEETDYVVKWEEISRYDVTQAASEFAQLSQEEASRVVDTLGMNYISEIVGRVATDAATAMLRNMSDEIRQTVLAKIESEKASDIRELLSYPEGTAGAIMAKEFLAIPVEATIKEATKYLQTLSGGKKGKVSYIYVVDRNRRLEGVIQIRDLIFHSPDKPIREILISPVVQVETMMSQLDIARLLKRHRYLGLPVVDAEQRIVGVISADNVLQAVEEEAEDDIAKIVGTSSEEIKTHSVKKVIRMRLPWLLISVLSGLMCALISGLFRNSIADIAVLFLFVPIVLGLSESAGVQSAIIVVRNITAGIITFKKTGALFVREFLAAMFISIICGTIVGAFAWMLHKLFAIGIAIAVSMFITMLISSIIGVFLPFVFKKFKIDPAFAAGPIVLAICDIQTISVYFTISAYILKLL